MGAGPSVDADRRLFELPASFVAEAMVVAARRPQVLDERGTSPGHLDGMVHVGVGGGMATPRKAAGGLSGLDMTSLGGGRAASGQAVGENGTGVGIRDDEAPPAVGLTLDDPAGDVGDDRSPPGDVCRPVDQAHQGGEVDADLDGTSGGRVVLVAALQQLHEHVGAYLVESLGRVGVFRF